MFIAYLVVWRITNSGSSYWRVASAAWICDSESVGEGRMLGLFSMVHHFGRSLASALVVLGIGWAGLVSKNCLDVSPELRAACEQEKINNQPESLANYLVMVLAFFAPAVELLVCILTVEFPIRPGSTLLADITAKKERELSSTQLEAQGLKEMSRMEMSPMIHSAASRTD